MFAHTIRRLILLYLIIAICSVTFSLAESKLDPLPKGVSIYQLDNGLQVMLIEKPSLPMVGINTIVKVGSAYENFATSGMSHMLEHLLFNGTTTMSQKELYDSTDIIGGYNNAHTGEYYTNFMMVTPAENILEGMKLQSEMLFNSVLPKEKFEKEKGIVLEEIAKSLAKSSEQIENNTLSIIYKGHALSLPTLGTYSTIENLNRNSVYSFYKNYYVPNNMIVSVIGNFNTIEMVNSLKRIYGKVKPGEIVYPQNTERVTGFNDFVNTSIGNVFHRFYKGKNTQLQLFFEIKKPKNLEFFDVLQLVLDDQKDSIQSELNKKYGDQIEGLEFSTRAYPVMNYIQASLILKNEDNLQSIQKSLLDLVYKIKFEVPIDVIRAEEIKTRTRFLKNTEKPHMFGIYNAGIFAEYGIEGILSSYSNQGFSEASKELESFSLSSNYITIVQHPELKSSLVEKKTNDNIKLFEGSDSEATIISKYSHGSGLLAIHYLLKNKASLENKYGKDAAKIWHDAFGKRMKNKESQKISSKFGFTFTVNDNPYIPMDNIYLSPEFGYIRVEGLSNNVESSINYLNDQMLNFIPTKEEFESALRKAEQPSMMGHGNKEKKFFESKLSSVLYKKAEESSNAKKLTYENFLKFGLEYFTPSNMIISLVSPSTADQIKKYFSSFKKMNTKAQNSIGYLKSFKEISEPQKIDIKKGGEQAYLYYGFQKLVQDNDKAALKVLSMLLSDKIIFDIREKQGLAYRMSAGINILKDKAMFYINMGTRPENVEKLIPQFSNFFSKNIADEITDVSIKKSVNMYLGRMMFRRLSSINQAYYLGHSKYFYNDISYDTKSLESIKNVTIDEVKSVIEKYMDVDNAVEVYIR